MKMLSFVLELLMRHMVVIRSIHAARLISRTPSIHHITPVMQHLHWLPVKVCIDFKIPLFTFTALHNLSPPYLSEVCPPHCHPLPFPQICLLCPPLFPSRRLVTMGRRAFSRSAPESLFFFLFSIFLLLFLFKYVVYGAPRVPREAPLNKMYYHYYYYLNFKWKSRTSTIHDQVIQLMKIVRFGQKLQKQMSKRRLFCQINISVLKMVWPESHNIL